MTLGRSLTKKGSKYLERVGVGSSSSSSSSPDSNRRASMRAQISAPVALISTTNMISYTSPSLRTSQSFTSTSSAASRSSSDSDSSPPSSPSSPTALSPNHLSTYFTTAPVLPARSPSRKARGSPTTPAASATPSLPRAPSSGSSGGRKSASAALSRGNSSQRHHSQPPHPFGAELAKVAELTEEIAQAGDADEEFMVEHGLQKFSANDYLSEILGIVAGDDIDASRSAGWI